MHRCTDALLALTPGMHQQHHQLLIVLRAVGTAAQDWQIGRANCIHQRQAQVLAQKMPACQQPAPVLHQAV